MDEPSHVMASTSRCDTSRHLAAQRYSEPSWLLVPVDPIKDPVYAGDLGPETWVVEVPAGVVPVTVPLNAIAVLAGFLPPHAYVTRVRQPLAVAGRSGGYRQHIGEKLTRCESDSVVKVVDEHMQLSEVARRLSTRYPHVPPATVAEVVQHLKRLFDGAPIREFVPLFVERYAHTALTELSVPYGVTAV